MQRDKWQFELTAAQLIDACTVKIKHHSDRSEFWKKNYDEVMAKVKESGISVQESAGAGGQNVTRSYGGPQVLIDTTLQRSLTEAHDKILEHGVKVAEYSGWQQVLNANSGRSYTLNSDDYLYFFGKK